jgi:hypothetical protein
MSLKQSGVLLFPGKHSHFHYTSFSENEVLAQADTVAPLIHQYFVYVTLLLKALELILVCVG